MPDNTGQVGESQVGEEQVGAGPSGAPPLDPSTVPFLQCSTREQEVTPPWRYRTQQSFARGPELPQPNLNPTTVPFLQCSTREQEVTPPWRYRTQESALYGAFPSFIPVKQISFFQRGFNRRYFGVPSFVGGLQQITVTMGGQDISKYVLATGAGVSSGIQITRQLATTGTCQFDMAIPTADTFRPLKGMPIIIQEFGHRRFAGYVDQLERVIYPGMVDPLINYVIHGVDWTATFQRRRVTLDTTPDFLINILQRILQNWSVPAGNSEGLTLGGVDPSLFVADPFSFPYLLGSDVMNQLCDAVDAIWWVDRFAVVWVQLAANCLPSTFALDGTKQVQSDDPGSSLALKVTDSLANYRNTQYVRTSSQILSTNVTLTDSHTFSGAEDDVVCLTQYPLSGPPASVKENGVELVGTPRLFQLHIDGTPTPFPPEGYYWWVGAYGIWHWPTSPHSQPIAGTVLVVKYTGLSTFQGNVVVFRDNPQIAAMAAIMGTTGIFEELQDYQGTCTYAAALALAQGIEQSTSPPPQDIDASTIEQIPDIGQTVAVNLPLYGLVGTWLILGYTQHSVSNLDLGKGSTFQTTLKLVLSKTQGNWINYFERLMARLAANEIPAPTEKLTWTLAMDTPGNVSPDLSVGAFGNALPVQVLTGQLLYVSAVFNTMPASTITIDILINGKSIFDSVKLQYQPGQTGITELYGNFASNPFLVQQNDQVILSVVSVDALSPGKNGTVVLVIGNR